MQKLNLDEANELMAEHAHLGFIRAWRSIGSHTFFEYGMPIIGTIKARKDRPQRTYVRGEASVHAETLNWFLYSNSREILNGEFVDSAQLAQVSKAHFSNLPWPTLGFDQHGTLELVFDKTLTMKLFEDDELDSEDNRDVELSIGLQGGDYLLYKYGTGFFYRARE